MSIEASRLSRSAICDYAELVGEKHRIFAGGDSANLDRLVRQLGGNVEVAISLISNEALTVRGEKDFTVHLPAVTSHRRDRFTIAHELGHYFLHYLQPRVQGVRTFGRGERNLAETQANYFAGALLMPSERFSTVWRQLGGDAWAVGDRFGVSASAASVRAQSLGLTS